MKTIVRILITAILVMLLANILPGIYVVDYWTAILVAVVLGLLNMFVKPLIIILTIPVTILTLGLFLFVINALMIQFSGYLVGGFKVESFWYALFFSIILSISQSIVFNLTQEKRGHFNRY
ncbi:MAG: phage holin family protein [Flavobacterium sp.]